MFHVRNGPFSTSAADIPEIPEIPESGVFGKIGHTLEFAHRQRINSGKKAGIDTNLHPVVAFLDVPSGDAFDVKPLDAIAFFKAKGLKTSFHYGDLMGEAHVHAFTVAKMMDVDMLGSVRKSLDESMAAGHTFGEWKKSIMPSLKSAGWWGKQELVDPLTGKLAMAQLGSASRLETIFRTNLQSAYSVGHWREIQTQKAIAPYLMYDAIDDFRTRPLHHAWDHTVLPADDPWWDSHYPINGWNCRCGVIQLSQAELDALGIAPNLKAPDSGPDYVWTNPRTGLKQMIPAGLDPGFNHNAGKRYLQDLKQVLGEKVAALPASMQAAAAKAAGEAEAAALQATADALAAQAKVEELAAAALARATAKAEAAALHEAAAVKLKAIAKGEVPDPSDYLATALKTLKKDQGWLEAKAGPQLAQVEELAAALKAKKTIANDLMHYKAAIVAGKVPSLKQKKTFDALTPFEQDSFLEKVDEAIKAKAAEGAKAIAAAEAAAKAEAEAIAAAEAVKLAEAKAAEHALAVEQAAAAKLAAKQALKAEKDAAKLAAKQAAADAAAAAQAIEDAAKAAKLKADVDMTVAILKGAKLKSASIEVPKAEVDNPVVVSRLTKVGGQKGSNEGGSYQDTETGQVWYIKHLASADNARNEVLTGKLYELAGYEVPEMHYIDFEGRPSIASKWIDGLQESTAEQLAAAPGVHEGFTFDAWLANRDVIGMTYDNLFLNKGRAFRVDTGAGLRYRAQGGLKGDTWGDVVTELDSMRQPPADQAMAVFKSISQANLEFGARRVLGLSDAQISETIEKYGPEDAKERAALIRRMLARKADIAKRFPSLVAKAEPAPIANAGARVSAVEQKTMVEARINGIVFKTDAEAIEDHEVLIAALKNIEGADVTRAWLKLQPDAAKKMLASIKDSGITDLGETAIRIDLSDVKSEVQTLVRGVGALARDKLTFRPQDLTRLGSTLDQLEKSIKALDGAAKIAKGSDLTVIQEHRALLASWQQRIKEYGPTIKVGEPAVAVGGPNFDIAKIQGFISYEPPALVAAKPAAGVLSWKRVSGFKYHATEINKGAAREIAKKWTVPGAGDHFEATLPDGTALRFFPNTEDATYTLRGMLHMDVPGASASVTERVFVHLGDLGVDATRAPPLARDDLYLNTFARTRWLADSRTGKDGGALKAFEALNALPVEARVKAKLSFVKSKIGLDIETTDGWSKREGVYQTFGHGRALQYRPDLDTAEFKQLEKDFLLYNNPQGIHYGGDLKDGTWAKLKAAFNGGGQLSSLSDRVRRGIPVSNGEGGSSSADDDFRRGGAASLFTRLRSTAVGVQHGPGEYWKAKVIKRMDAITYTGDKFGDTTEAYGEYRLGATVATMRKAAANELNETIFRGSLSLFDDLEKLVLYSKKEYDEAMADLKAWGYKEWPDGRKLEEVITYYLKPKKK